MISYLINKLALSRSWIDKVMYGGAIKYNAVLDNNVSEGSHCKHFKWNINKFAFTVSSQRYYWWQLSTINQDTIDLQCEFLSSRYVQTYQLQYVTLSPIWTWRLSSHRRHATISRVCFVTFHLDLLRWNVKELYLLPSSMSWCRCFNELQLAVARWELLNDLTRPLNSKVCSLVESSCTVLYVSRKIYNASVQST